MGVDSCGRCAIVSMLPQIAMLHSKFQKNDLSVDLSTYIALLWNEGNILSFEYDLSEGLIQKQPLFANGANDAPG